MEFVGVDVGKRKCVASKEAGDDYLSLAFENNAGGFEKLMAFCPPKAQIVMESTGHYGNCLMMKARNRGMTVKMVNAFSMSKFSKAVNRDTKTDKTDARQILMFAKINPRAFRVPTFSDLKPITRLRMETSSELSRTRLQIGSVMDQLFPELGHVFHDMGAVTAVRLLESHPTPKSICQLGLEDLTAFLKKHSRGQLGQERAEKLLDAAQNSFGLENSGLEIQLKVLLIRYKSLRRQRRLLDEQIKLLCPQNLLMSIPGMGPVFSAVVLAELGDEPRASADQIRGYAGLRPQIHQSGEFVATQKRMSKTGNRYLRTAFYMAAMSAVGNNPQFRALYQKKLEAGKRKKVALCHIASKLASITFGVLKNQKPFDEACLKASTA